MGNKGLKSYTKQLSFELGEMKAFVNPNISDSNLIITLPLVTTRGSDPLSMSLIYNFLDDINGDIISGVKNSFYSKRKVSYVIEMPDGTKEEIDLTKGFDFGRGIEGEGIEYRNILEDIYPQEIRHHKQNIPIKYKDNMEYDYGVTHIDSTDNRIHKIYRNGDLIEINGQGEYRAYVGTKVVSQCKEVIGEGILSIEYYGDFGNIIDEYSISRRRIISDGVEKYIITMKSNEENMYYEFYLDTNKKVTSIIQLNKKDSSFSKKANIEYDNNVSHIYSEAIIGNDGKTIENRHDAYICFDENNNVSYEYNNKGIYTYYLYSKDGKLLECAGPIDTNDLGFFKDIKGRYYMENSSKNLMFKKEFHDGNRGDYSVLLKLKFNRRADVNVMFYNENVCESKMISYNGDRPVSKLVVLELKDNSARNYLECLIENVGTNDVEVEFIRVYEGSLLTQYKYDDNKLMSVINGRGFEVYKYDNLERITKTFSSNGSSSVITYEGNTSIIKERMANSLKEYNSDYYKNIKDLPQSSILEYEDLNGIHKLNNKCSYQSYSGIISDYIDEFGSKVSYLYDDKYNLSSIVHNDEVNKISNDRKGRISSYRILKNSSSLHDVSIVYDDLNSSYAYINNDEQEYRFKYDDFGNVTEVYYHNIKIVSREYCKYTNRLLKESVNNKEYKYKYDGDGKLVEVVDERNRVVCKYQYDAFNRVTKTSDNNYQSAYTYDDNDAMLVNDELYEREYRALNNNLVIKENEDIYEYETVNSHLAHNLSVLKELFIQENKNINVCTFEDGIEFKDSKSIKNINLNKETLGEKLVFIHNQYCYSYESGVLNYRVDRGGSSTIGLWVKGDFDRKGIIMRLHDEYNNKYISVSTNYGKVSLITPVDGKEKTIISSSSIQSNVWNYVSIKIEPYFSQNAHRVTLVVNDSYSITNVISSSCKIGQLFEDGESIKIDLGANLSSFDGIASMIYVGDDNFSLTNILSMYYKYKDCYELEKIYALPSSNSKYYKQYKNVSVYPLHSSFNSLSGEKPYKMISDSNDELSRGDDFIYDAESKTNAYYACGNKLIYQYPRADSYTIGLKFKVGSQKVNTRTILEIDDHSGFRVRIYVETNNKVMINFCGQTTDVGRVNLDRWNKIVFSYGSDYVYNREYEQESIVRYRLYLNGVKTEDYTHDGTPDDIEVSVGKSKFGIKWIYTNDVCQELFW